VNASWVEQTQGISVIATNHQLPFGFIFKFSGFRYS
jgi:hypothetical protein